MVAVVECNITLNNKFMIKTKKSLTTKKKFRLAEKNRAGRETINQLHFYFGLNMMVMNCTAMDVLLLDANILHQ